MQKLLLIVFFLPVIASAQKYSQKEIERFKRESADVKIARDNYGVPHIYGQTDADCIFGLMYTQCEDNFKGIERNYLYQMGRQSEVDGEKSLYADVQLQLVADTTEAKTDYLNAPPFFRKLLDAFADGMNYYLYKHPEVKSTVFKRFYPWYPLMFTDGSVSSTITGGLKLSAIKEFYGNIVPGAENADKNDLSDKEAGSNGFAIAPSKSASGHAMLYINPHVPFYFRSEVQMISEEGLDVYGAVTWGQFFVYQGFNSHCGWMHTSSNADVGDLYAEKVFKVGGKWLYEYDGANKVVGTKRLIINVKKGNKLEKKIITGYFTHHGPVLGTQDGKWLALKAVNRSYSALLESWLITKAANFLEFKNIMGALLSNATNNTVYADDQGNTAFWYGNFMPKRDPNIDWDLPVDGSSKATEWQGFHSLAETIHVYNPETGWIQNCNSSPFFCSGTSSPDKEKYPGYMATNGQNFRAINAIRLLSNVKSLTFDQLIDIGYDHYLAAFDVLLPALFNAYDATTNDSLKQALLEPIIQLKHWDKQSDANSIATAVAIEWGDLMMKALRPAITEEEGTYQSERINIMLRKMTKARCLSLFNDAVNNLKTRYGTWQVKWGDINRYQRPADGVTFDDSKPSIPVGLASSTFGQLPSYQSKPMNTKNRYGYSGNSFVAVVEFGLQIKAKSIITGGQSFNPSSDHFVDQAEMYAEGKFKDVYFYKDDVFKHIEKIYHPGSTDPVETPVVKTK